MHISANECTLVYISAHSIEQQCTSLHSIAVQLLCCGFEVAVQLLCSVCAMALSWLGHGSGLPVQWLCSHCAVAVQVLPFTIYIAFSGS